MKLTAKTSDRVNSMNCSLVLVRIHSRYELPRSLSFVRGSWGIFPRKVLTWGLRKRVFRHTEAKAAFHNLLFFFFINLEDSTVPTCFYIGVSNPVFVSSHKNFSAVASIQHFVLKKKLTRLIAKSSYQYICSYLRKVNIPHLRSYLN